MGKAAKNRHALKRRAEKQKRKAANVARYASYIGTSANKKKKGRNNKASSSIPGHPHLNYCGNFGCKRCFETD